MGARPTLCRNMCVAFHPIPIFAATPTEAMQDIVFAIAKFFETLLSILPVLGWAPVVICTLLGFFGLFYWLMLQARYNREAREKNTLA